MPNKGSHARRPMVWVLDATGEAFKHSGSPVTAVAPLPVRDTSRLIRAGANNRFISNQNLFFLLGRRLLTGRRMYAPNLVNTVYNTCRQRRPSSDSSV